MLEVLVLLRHQHIRMLHVVRCDMLRLGQIATTPSQHQVRISTAGAVC